MPRACELRKGSIVAIDGKPHIVEDLQVQTPSARGSATLYKVRYRNLQSKQKADRSYRGDDMVPDADFERRDVQFSYVRGDEYVFTDTSDYSELSIKADDIEEERPYLREEMEGIKALLSEGQVLGIELPPAVDLKVVECDPSMRGASVTARTKPAKLETGLTVQVPEYLSAGETVRVDTRTGRFLSRA
jgi:elongation factor P